MQTDVDDRVVVEGDTKTETDSEDSSSDEEEEEENEVDEVDEWLVQSDRQQVEKGSETTSFMEWVRKRVPNARYPEWSTGAQRERQIKEEVERRQQCSNELDLEILTMCGEGIQCSM